MTTLSPLTQSFLQAIQTDSLPSLGPDSRPGVKSRDELLELAAAFCKANGMEENTRRLLQSAALLWHDDLDGSHEISQGVQTTDGSFLHGIMHRREPDNSNAKYWFRRVGDHPSFPALAVAVRDFAAADSQTLGEKARKGMQHFIDYNRGLADIVEEGGDLWMSHMLRCEASGIEKQLREAEKKTIGESGVVFGESDFVSSLIPEGRWDAFSFVDACHRAMKQAESPSAAEIRKNLQKIQELEFQTLLNHFFS